MLNVHNITLHFFFRQGQGNGTIAYMTTGIDFSDGSLTETNYSIRIKGDEVPGSLVTQVSPGENSGKHFYSSISFLGKV